MSRLIKIAFRVHMGSCMFLLCCGAVAATSAVTALAHRTEEPYFDSFKHLPFVIALAAVCVSLVFGLCVEFSDGTVKNKLIRGYSRLQFCFSQLIAALAEAVIFGLLAWAPYYLIKRESFFSLYSAEVLLRAFGLLFVSLLMMTLLAFAVCITVRRMTLSLIVCGLVFFGLALASEWLENELRLPVYTLENGETDYVYDPETGSVERIILREPDRVPYPWYVDGVRRDIYYALYAVNPMTSMICGGDYLQYSDSCFSMKAKEYYIENHGFFNDTYAYNMDFIRDYRIDNIYYPIWSGSAVLVVTVIGIIVFWKRNIN